MPRLPAVGPQSGVPGFSTPPGRTFHNFRSCLLLDTMPVGLMADQGIVQGLVGMKSLLCEGVVKSLHLSFN